MSNPFVKIDTVTISLDSSSLVTDIEWSRKGKGNSSDPKGDLTLTFVKGERYEYIGVPSTVLQKLLVSESIGKFFHKNIKDQYVTYVEVENG